MTRVELTAADVMQRIGLGLLLVALAFVVGDGLYASPLLSAAMGSALSIALLADIIFGPSHSLPKMTVEFFAYSALANLLMMLGKMVPPV